MTRIIVVDGGTRAGKSEASRMMRELAREHGYVIVDMGPGATGRVADTIILDELSTSPFADMPEKISAPEKLLTPNNRKARRAQAAERRRSK